MIAASCDGELADLAGDAGGHLLVTLALGELHVALDEGNDWFPLNYQELFPRLLGLLDDELGTFSTNLLKSEPRDKCYRLNKMQYSGWS